MNPKLTNNQRYNFPTAKQFSHITKSALRIREKAFENPLYSERFKIASNTLLERMNHTNNSLFDGVNKYDIKLGIDKHLTSAMAFRFDNEQHKKFRELYEKGLETQLKLRKTLDELVEIYPFFHESGWLVPDIMAPKYIIHIKNASQADEFMKKNIHDDTNVILVSLQTTLKNNNIPDNINTLLMNIIESLKHNISSYTIMLPTLFSIIDYLTKEWLKKYITEFPFLKTKVLDDLIKEFNNIKANQSEVNKKFKTLYQAEALMELLLKYYPEKSIKYMKKLTRNAVAHGSFDYNNYTIYDFAKVALMIEHISGLRDMFEEYNS